MNTEQRFRIATCAIAIAAVLTGGHSAQGVGVPLHDGLISCWALDEGLGNIAFDSAPGGTVADNGQLRNSPTWIDGMFDAGLHFNGLDEDVLIPASSDMDIAASAVTLSTWVKLDLMPASIAGSFAGILDSQADNYVLYLDKGNNELRFKVTSASGVAERPGVPASMLDTTDWHHVMGVYDGAGRARIFFDGALVDMHAAAGLIGNVRAGQISGLGSQPAAFAGNPPGSMFQGDLADFAIWNRPLGLAEAQYLYNSGTGNPIGAANPSIEPIVSPGPNNPSVIVAAHRGNSIAAPENTLSAIIAAGGFADRVEFDVRPTSDGKLVLMHDGSVDRTTNGSGSVASRDYDYISGLDAGSWFSNQFVGEPVPTMQQAVETTLAHGMTPLIEHKAGSAAAYVNELTLLGVLEDVVIISFDWNFLSQVRALDESVQLGALGSGTLNSSVISSILDAGANFVNWGDGGSVTQATVDMVHAAGLEMHVWTVNSMPRMQGLINLGVDGITTDDPETLRALVPLPSLAGDFNNDGVVDGADYTVWRDGLGSLYTAEQYNDWKSNFGSKVAEASVAQSAVPEPATLWLLGMACTTIAPRLRRRHARIR